MSSSTQDPSISPFSLDARISFERFLNDQDLKRRVRPTDEKHTHLREYLYDVRQAVTQDERRLKFKAFREYKLVDGRLHTQADQGSKGGKGQRYVPRDEEVFDIISAAHLGLLHPGLDKTFCEIERTTTGVSRREVTELLKHCSTCAKKASQKSKAPMKAIVENVLSSAKLDLRPDAIA